MTTCKDNYYPKTHLRQEVFYFYFLIRKYFKTTVVSRMKLN